ncbi:hypothetical protein PTTG_25388 [Puccinia triticina 1-1 BBBD Race 1]|uniref:Uncharacterized protein n=1 Tax=Puccinia triticina (isolate 1-1 / race 1 (BBBD)) TaxID=630390 RepID=A0A180H3V1_PUCT1|nr:hypothetical protein PTTG_25388 [Puccinia triticina 1-1 BBBD Race 1]
MSKSKFQAEKQLKGITGGWKLFQNKLDQGLHDAVQLHVKEETNKAVRLKLENHFRNWNSREIKILAEERAGELEGELDVGMGIREKIRILGVRKGLRFRRHLVKKLTSVPQSSDEEFQFISEQLIKDSPLRSERKTDLEWLKETHTSIAKRFKFAQEKILDFKLQFHLAQIVKQLEQSIRDDAHAELTHMLESLTKNTEVMENAYRVKVDDLIHSEHKDFQVQLFKAYFGIEKSAQEIYNTLKELTRKWQVNFTTFRKKFQHRLPRDEYNGLLKAASVSKEEYTHLLEYIKEQRGINLFKKLKEKHLPIDKDSIKHFLVRLKENKILNDKRFLELHARVITSSEDPLAFMESLEQELKAPIKVYDELEAESIPIMMSSLTHTSIQKFLDELTDAEKSKRAAEGILTQEERNYFYPYWEADPVKSFRDKMDIINLPKLFEERLRFRAHKQFAAILEDKSKDKSFRSLTLSHYLEDVIAEHKEDLEYELRQGNYASFLEKLQSKSIKTTARDHATDELWASKFWNVYFTKELPARTSILNELRIKKEQRQPIEEKLEHPEKLRNKVLDGFFPKQKNPESENFGVPWRGFNQDLTGSCY